MEKLYKMFIFHDHSSVKYKMAYWKSQDGLLRITGCLIGDRDWLIGGINNKIK